jgi:hypothetical protein
MASCHIIKEGHSTNGRVQIGKFGIGKLATYLLAEQLTYLCKAVDGVIRAVTIDYRDIDGSALKAEDGKASATSMEASDKGTSDVLHKRNALELEVRELNDAELHALLGTFANGNEIKGLIDQECLNLRLTSSMRTNLATTLQHLSKA